MEKIRHLYWRAGFGLSLEEWQNKRNWPITKAVDELFTNGQQAAPITFAEAQMPETIMDIGNSGKALRRKLERKIVATQNVDWIQRMADPKESALVERMSLFWHGHFACRSLIGNLANNQLNTIRAHALGSFRELVLAIARDPAMIRYLNNQQNKKNSPNENFARELMELFTIGRGNYSEQDIKESARAFTGWSSNLQGEYVFRMRQHDYGSKTFFGKKGNFNGEEIIDILLEQKQTADFITRKIYRYFVNRQVDEDIVRELSQQFYESNYDIGQLMQTIFTSDWFYAAQNQGAKIKSPIEFMAGIIRQLNVNFEEPTSLVFVQKALGQMLFNPPNVAGWPGGKNWIDNSTLMLRLNLTAYLLTTSEINMRTKDEFEAQQRGKAQKKLKATVDLLPIIRWAAPLAEPDCFESLSQWLLTKPNPLDVDFIRSMLKDQREETFIQTAVMALMSLPEYQMC
ncbi:MAG: hypothetical protein DHS20C18_25250 [Saprospiraceae bacterium]|nr:MAG: hypothetical protein DHS20C18_25250 [Saprospiraceae bacterium]